MQNSHTKNANYHTQQLYFWVLMKQSSMATITSSLHPSPSFLTRKYNNIKFNHASSLTKTCAQSQGTEPGVSEDASSIGMYVCIYSILNVCSFSDCVSCMYFYIHLTHFQPQGGEKESCVSYWKINWSFFSFFLGNANRCPRGTG